jgi:hypothetical protein
MPLKVSAQRGQGWSRYEASKLTAEDIELLYEMTYKLQMLESEEKFGDRGLPTILPDRANIMKLKIGPALEAALGEAHASMVDTYDEWINEHDPSDQALEENARESAESEMTDFMRGWPELEELAERFGETNILGTLLEFYDENVGEPAEFHEENIRYLYPERFQDEKQAQVEQKQFPFMEDTTTEWVEAPDKGVVTDTDLLSSFETMYENHKKAIIEEIKDTSYYSDAIYSNIDVDAERENYELDTALGGVKEMRERLNDWKHADLSEKIIIFQEALTTAHNNGDMADYLIDMRKTYGKYESAVDLLNQMSGGRGLEAWNRDLSQWLGHAPGSTMTPPDVWTHPACRHLAQALMQLTDRYDALGMPHPDEETMCQGHCEGTGYVPVYMPEYDPKYDPKSSVSTEVDDPEFIELFLQAEMEFPTDDGWHFVKCPDCDGTGRRTHADTEEDEPRESEHGRATL